MTTLEARLTTLEARLGETRKSTGALTIGLQRLAKAAAQGHFAEIDKSLAVVSQRAEEVRRSAAALPEAWSFDARQYLERGYVAELLQESKLQGVNLVERDERLYCFPLVIRVEPREANIRLGKKREQRLRPKNLVANLAAMQKARPRFNAQRFLDAVYQVYRRVQGEALHKLENGPGPAMPLADVYDVLTLLPGSDYPIEEFGRDLLLLARQPDLRVRDGHTFEFLGSTLSKERLKRINVFDEQGSEVVFVAVRFGKGA